MKYALGSMMIAVIFIQSPVCAQIETQKCRQEERNKNITKQACYAIPTYDPRCIWTQTIFPADGYEEVVCAWRTDGSDGEACIVRLLTTGVIEIIAHLPGNMLCHLVKIAYNPTEKRWQRVHSAYLQEDSWQNITKSIPVHGDGIFEGRYGASLEFFPDEQMKRLLQEAISPALSIPPE